MKMGNSNPGPMGNWQNEIKNEMKTIDKQKTTDEKVHNKK